MSYFSLEKKYFVLENVQYVFLMRMLVALMCPQEILILCSC